MEKNLVKNLKVLVESEEISKAIALIDKSYPTVNNLDNELIKVLMALTKAFKKFVKSEISLFDKKFKDDELAEDFYVDSYKALSNSIKDKSTRLSKALCALLKREKSVLFNIFLNQMLGSLYVVLIGSGVEGVSKNQQFALFYYKKAVTLALERVKPCNSTKYLLFFEYMKFIYGIMEDKFRSFLICKEVLTEIKGLEEKSEEVQLIEEKFKAFLKSKQDEIDVEMNK